MNSAARLAMFDKSARFDEMRRKSVALARMVSSVLKAAGFAKSAPYRPYGGFDRGYTVFQSGNGTGPEPECCVADTGNGGEGRAEKIEAYAACLRADGRFTIKEYKPGPSATLRVVRANASKESK